MTGFTGVDPAEDGRSFRLRDGAQLTLEKSLATSGLTGFGVAVPALELVADRLLGEGIPFDRHPDRLEIAGTHAYGARLGFELAGSP